MSWRDYLQPASWRGVPFQVFTSEVVAGRKVAVHDYPYRDDVWPEDTGKKARSISFRGFLVGDDCFIQEISMLQAAETPGPGELIHPSLGSMQVSLLEFSSGQDFERGRTVTLNFRFIQGTSTPLYPGIDVSTGNAVDDNADAADSAAGGDFGDEVGTALQQGESVVQGAIQTVQGFVSQVQGAISDASLLAHAVAGIVPPAGATFGRYAAGGLGVLQAGVTTAAQALATVTAAQAAVQAAAIDATNLAGDL